MPKLTNETYTEYLTIEWIIDNLKKDGYGTKQKVLRRLENALLSDLKDLRKSIQKEILKRLDIPFDDAESDPGYCPDDRDDWDDWDQNDDEYDEGIEDVMRAMADEE